MAHGEETTRIGQDLALFIDSRGRAGYRPFRERPEHVEAVVKEWLERTPRSQHAYEFVERWYATFDPKADSESVRDRAATHVETTSRRNVRPVLQQPVEPRPQDFGLSDERAKWFASSDTGCIPIGMALLVYILVATGLALRSHWLLAFFAFFPVLALSGLAIDAIDRVRKRHQPDHENFRRYSHAVQQFREDRADYEAAITAERRRQVTWWQSLDGTEFERERGELLRLRGYDVRETGHAGDGGVDLLLRQSGRIIIVPCKAHRRHISAGSVRDLCGASMHWKADEAWLVSTHGFSRQARTFASGKRIRLITISELLEDSPGQRNRQRRDSTA